MAPGIGTLNLGLMSSFELRNVSQRTAEAIAATPGADPYLVKTGSRMVGLLEDQWRILSRAPVDSLTRELSDADDHRDRAFLSLKARLRYHQSLVSDPSAAAAEHLLGIIKVHGSELHLAPYAVESTRIAALLKDLDQPANHPHIEATGATPDIERLRTASAAFDVLLSGRAARGAAEADDPGLSANRAHLRRELSLAVEVIESEHRNGAGVWAKTLGDTVAEILLSVVPAAKRRRTAAKNEEDAAPKPNSSGTTSS